MILLTVNLLMCFVINIPKFIHNIPKCEFTKEEIKKLIQAPSNEVISKIDDHVSELQALCRRCKSENVLKISSEPMGYNSSRI